ncbi:unnamed protein product [Mycena citricolor]|uniref:Metallo-beta-lactamase domain-containing protein n=1 Tax=Mycena citricolor TaxID=2018698 RepID=A0AAD2HMY5_9AGAR|nr:unnamed protein product [Mycena citricolor]CAK5278355.1 unnamed protein product [Mycena citricolor]
MVFLHTVSLSLLSLALSARASFQDFGIPQSDATVNVRVFDVGTTTMANAMALFVHPVLTGRENMTSSMLSFLIEHNGKRILFDLGMRNDTQNFSPTVASYFPGLVAKLDEPNGEITGILKTAGIPLNTINAVIWSHAHFDHIGDMSKFPNSTELIIGSETDMDTYPQVPTASLKAEDFAGRTVTKIDFSKANLTFSGLKAIDYFGDGSFYLMDTPGHMAGHITALARTTNSSFIVLGADTFHHPGEVRPRPAFQQQYPCPAHLLEDAKAISTDYFWSPKSSSGVFDLTSRPEQLFAVADTAGSFYADPVTSEISIVKLANFDADPDFFVLASHDISLRGAIPVFPAFLNQWKQQQLKENSVWGFLNKSSPSFIFTTV